MDYLDGNLIRFVSILITITFISKKYGMFDSEQYYHELVQTVHQYKTIKYQLKYGIFMLMPIYLVLRLLWIVYDPDQSNYDLLREAFYNPNDLFLTEVIVVLFLFISYMEYYFFFYSNDNYVLQVYDDIILRNKQNYDDALQI